MFFFSRRLPPPRKRKNATQSKIASSFAQAWKADQMIDPGLRGQSLGRHYTRFVSNLNFRRPLVHNNYGASTFTFIASKMARSELQMYQVHINEEINVLRHSLSTYRSISPMLLLLSLVGLMHMI